MNDFDNQFRETPWEREERWRRAKARRKAAAELRGSANQSQIDQEYIEQVRDDWKP